MAPRSPLPRPSLSQPAYLRVRDQIRAEILRGELKPGSRLLVSELARRYGVSQMPVRDALQLLQGEGIVTNVPHQGASVRDVNEAFIRNMYDVLLLLTEYLVGRAAEKIEAADIAALEAIQSEIEEAAARNDIERILELNGEFNDRIFQVADNPEAMRIVQQYRGLRDALRYKSGFSPERLEMMCREHRALIAALAERDAQRAAAIARDHSRAAQADLLARLKADALKSDSLTHGSPIHGSPEIGSLQPDASSPDS